MRCRHLSRCWLVQLTQLEIDSWCRRWRWQPGIGVDERSGKASYRGKHWCSYQNLFIRIAAKSHGAKTGAPSFLTCEMIQVQIHRYLLLGSAEVRVTAPQGPRLSRYVPWVCTYNMARPTSKGCSLTPSMLSGPFCESLEMCERNSRRGTAGRCLTTSWT